MRFGPTDRVGSERGAMPKVVSKPRFRRLWKKALNDFLKGF